MGPPASPVIQTHVGGLQTHPPVKVCLYMLGYFFIMIRSLYSDDAQNQSKSVNYLMVLSQM